MRISEGHQANAIDQIDAGVPTLARRQHLGNGRKHLLLANAVGQGVSAPSSIASSTLRRLLGLVGHALGKDVEQKLGVALGVDVAHHPISHEALQLLGVGQVAVVGDADAKRVVGVEGLRLGATARTSGGVPDMTQTDVAAQFGHVMGLEHILDEAVGLAQVEAAVVGRDDSGGVLAAVLQDREAVEEGLVHVRRPVVKEEGDDAAHIELFVIRLRCYRGLMLGCRRFLIDATAQESNGKAGSRPWSYFK